MSGGSWLPPRGGGAGWPDGEPASVFKRCPFCGNFPVWVSEGGLNKETGENFLVPGNQLRPRRHAYKSR
jgi:hypothetical protein